MNPTMSSFLFLLSLAFCLTLHPHLTAATHPDGPLAPLIEKACALAPKKDFCQNVLKSEPLTPKKNLNDLTFVALDVASNTAASNIEFISQALAASEKSDDPSDAEVMQMFQDCEEQYEGAVDEIDNAISALATGPNRDQIETLLKDAITAVETCQRSAKGQTGGKGQQLAHKNEYLLDLLNNALTVFHFYIQK